LPTAVAAAFSDTLPIARLSPPPSSARLFDTCTIALWLAGALSAKLWLALAALNELVAVLAA
jgi:hypothetical protein